MDERLYCCLIWRSMDESEMCGSFWRRETLVTSLLASSM
jgi:hypothetical protein